MIVLNVIEDDPSCGLYLMGGPRLLKLPDCVRCEKWSGGLQLIAGRQKHRFNKAGEYIGTIPQTDRRITEEKIMKAVLAGNFREYKF